MPAAPLQIAVLVSGSGTTLQNLIDQIAAGRLDARIALVIGSRAGLRGIERAAAAGIQTRVVDRRDFTEPAQFSEAVFAHCAAAAADLVCMAGWLCLLPIPPAYMGKVMNIHPSLLPSFGGKGLYGPRVHQAVLERGAKISGCTVHFVDNQYDNGPIILQRPCPVAEDDTAESLAHRVFEEEKIAYPQAIALFHANRLKIEGRRVAVLP